MTRRYGPVLEKHIEEPVSAYAKARGAMYRKLNGMGCRDWPDKMFLGDRGRVLFVEFKRPGEEPTDLQRLNHASLRALGHTVLVIDNAEAGKLAVEEFLRGGTPKEDPVEVAKAAAILARRTCSRQVTRNWKPTAKKGGGRR